VQREARPLKPPPPLPISCNGADCGNNLHCFRRTKKLISPTPKGTCLYCGTSLVNWDRVHCRDLGDVTHTMTSLNFEFIRHHFWAHVVLDPHAVNYARRKGRIGMVAAMEHRIRQSVGPGRPFHDGGQTPLEGSHDPRHYAQHATASCCRKCIEEWHGIPQGKPLTTEQITYLRDLAMIYIDKQLPDLSNLGEKVAPIRDSRASTTVALQNYGKH